MKKVKSLKTNFINDLKDSSFLKKKFFKSLIKKPISYSFKYFVKLILLVSLLFIFIFLIKINLLFGFKYFDSLINNALFLPNNLIVTIKNNTLTTNQNMPTFLWSSKNHNGKLFAVIDETASEEKIKKYNSLILFTSKSIVFNNDPNTKPVSVAYNSQYLKITKNEITEISNIIKKFFPFMMFFIFVMISIFAPIGIFIGYLIYIGVLSLIIHFVFKLFSTKHKFQKTFQIALHSSTLPIIINTLFPSNNVFSLIILIFIILSIYNVYIFKRHK